MGIQLYTQMMDPGTGPDDNTFWAPCLDVIPFHHDPVETDSILVTHINAIDACRAQLSCSKKVYCIGPRTKDRLASRGFKNIVMLGKTASEAEIPLGEIITWLHGDSYARDFSVYPNIVPMQVYSLEVNINNIRRIPGICPDRIWVYSQKVVEALESEIMTRRMDLMCTDSCDPKPGAWKSVTRFYPGE